MKIFGISNRLLPGRKIAPTPGTSAHLKFLCRIGFANVNQNVTVVLRGYQFRYIGDEKKDTEADRPTNKRGAWRLGG
jgi:hypothetical protein